jgi:hypothetical protein
LIYPVNERKISTIAQGRRLAGRHRRTPASS